MEPIQKQMRKSTSALSYRSPSKHKGRVMYILIAVDMMVWRVLSFLTTIVGLVNWSKVDPTSAAVSLSLLFSPHHLWSKGHGYVSVISFSPRTCDLLPSLDISSNKISDGDDPEQIPWSTGQRRTSGFQARSVAAWRPRPSFRRSCITSM